MSENTLDQNSIVQITNGDSPETAFLLSEKPLASSFDALPLVQLTNQSQAETPRSVTAALSESSGGPVTQDDFAITALNTPVSISVVSNDVHSDKNSFEVVLLNNPVGAKAVVNDHVTIAVTPEEGFLGTLTIHYLVEDFQGNSSEATISVEVLTQFAFDTFDDLSAEETDQNSDVCQPSCCRHDSITEKIFTLTAEPIFGGSACPGALVAGRIYDQSGSLVGQASVNSDQKGKWKLQIDEVRDQEFYRIEFFHLPNGCSTSDVGFLVDPDIDAYQVMKTLTLQSLG